MRQPPQKTQTIVPLANTSWTRRTIVNRIALRTIHQ
jgi:hypothetical protein